MFENHLLNLNAAIADSLLSLQGYKTAIVRLQKYEDAAKLRDIEKQLENVQRQLSKYVYPAYDIIKGLTPKGKLFYNQIFNYCIARNWKEIPQGFINLLKNRKTELNKLVEFNDDTSAHLIKLSQNLTHEEDRIREFGQFIHYVLSVKGLKDCLDELDTGKLILKCYTNGKYYEFGHGSFNNTIPFYQTELPLNDLLQSLSIFYSTGKPQTAFLPLLPLKLIEEKICLLFSFLATDGLLAWEDFFNIDRIEFDLNVRYKFNNPVNS